MATFALAACTIWLAAAGSLSATTITASPTTFAAQEGVAFNGAVATFTDDNPAATPADFTATIDWGDGSPTTAGSIGSSSADFVVLGQHTYADEGSFTVTVTISDQPPGTGTATATSTAGVAEGDVLSGTPVSFSAPAGVSFTGAVANFTDTFTGALVSDFAATIDWGDATVSAGTVSGGSGTFQVSGTHTYAATGTFSVTVTLSDDKPGTATAQVTSTAHISNGLAVTAVNFSTPEATTFNGTVATFSDADTTKTPASFTTSINWGDGTPVTPGTVTGGSGSFTLSGQHVYADEGSFTTTVTVSEVAPGTNTGTANGAATVTEHDVLTPSAVVVSPTAAVPFTGTVATFTDTNTANTASDLTATINWGDGTPATAGTVVGGSGSFTVSGTHTYAASGPFTISVVLADDAPGTASATASSTANVAAAPVAAVPTLDPRGLLLLVLALGAAGLYLLRRG